MASKLPTKQINILANLREYGEATISPQLSPTLFRSYVSLEGKELIERVIDKSDRLGYQTFQITDDGLKALNAAQS